MNKIAPWNDPRLKWVCEDHPAKEQGHRLWFWKRCGGAGMPEPHDAKGHVCTAGCSNYQPSPDIDRELAAIAGSLHPYN